MILHFFSFPRLVLSSPPSSVGLVPHPGPITLVLCTPVSVSARLLLRRREDELSPRLVCYMGFFSLHHLSFFAWTFHYYLFFHRLAFSLAFSSVVSSAVVFIVSFPFLVLVAHCPLIVSTATAVSAPISASSTAAAARAVRYINRRTPRRRRSPRSPPRRRMAGHRIHPGGSPAGVLDGDGKAHRAKGGERHEAELPAETSGRVADAAAAAAPPTAAAGGDVVDGEKQRRGRRSERQHQLVDEVHGLGPPPPARSPRPAAPPMPGWPVQSTCAMNKSTRRHGKRSLTFGARCRHGQLGHKVAPRRSLLLT
ncbi:unnamed protein product [Urochloa humidicola]